MRIARHVSLLAFSILAACSDGSGSKGDSPADGSSTDPSDGASSADPNDPAASFDPTDPTSQCLPLECEAPTFTPPPKREWRHSYVTPATVTIQGDPRHRGRDLFVNPGEPQIVIGKFAYGQADKDLEDEEVDIFVQRACANEWEKLGTAITSQESAPNPTVEGVVDTGGRVYFEIPKDKHLPLGRHRIRFVVAGDGSTADMFLDVVPPKTPIFVSDVDGTLTSSEGVEATAYLQGVIPETHPGAPEALRALAAKGYRPLYLTARPEWLVQRTREFLDKHGFPPGLVHSSTVFTGAGIGDSAASFKTDEFAMLAEKGLVPSFAFGNKVSDAQAYASVQPPEHRILFQLNETFEGRGIQSYTELVPEFEALPAVCRR